MKQRINNYILPDEKPLFFYLFFLAFFYGLAIVFSYTSSLSLFLTAFSAAELPLIYVVAAVVISLTGFLNISLSAKYSPQIIFTILLILIIGSGIALRVGLISNGSPLLYFVLLIWFRFLFSVTGYIFWGAASQLLTLRQGKRLLGGISAGQTIATIIGYALVPWILSFTRTENLLVITVGALLIMLAFMLLAYRSAEQSDTRKDPLVFQENFLTYRPLKDQYLRSIFLITLIVYVVYFFIDFNFYGEVSLQYTSADELAIFISQFFSLIYLSSFLIQGLLTAVILKRFGLRTTLLIFPATIVLFSVLFTTAGYLNLTTLAFFLILSLKYFDEVVQLGFLKPAFTLFYQPFTAQKKIVTQTYNDIIAIPLGTGLAGLILLFIPFSGLRPTALILFTIIACIFLYTMINRAFKGYKGSLTQALSMRQIHGKELNLNDPETVAIIAAKLKSKHIGEAIYAIELLTRAEAFDILNPALKEFIDHPDPLLRNEVTKRIAQLNFAPLIPFLENRLTVEEDPAVQTTILHTMGKLGGPDTISHMIEMLDHANPHIRFAVMVGLMQSGLLEGQARTTARLEDLVHSEDPAERLLAAKVMGAVGSNKNESHLLLLLHDIQREIVCEAILSLGKIKESDSWPTLIDLLKEPDFESCVTQALIHAGDDALPAVEEKLQQNNLPVRKIAQLLKICGLIETPQAIYLLQKNLFRPEIDLREQLLENLQRSGYRVTPKSKPYLEGIIQDEIKSFAFLLAAADHLAGLNDTYLTSALHQARERSRHRHNLALSIYHHSNAILNATRLADRGSVIQKAQAIEFLELSINGDQTPHALTIALNQRDSQKMADLLEDYSAPYETADQWLEALARADDLGVSAWLKACVFYALGQRHHPISLATVEKGANSNESIVAETAEWAKNKLFENSEQNQKENDQMLLMIEKVMTLKSAEVFSEIPEQTLSAVAEKTNEMRLQPGEILFNKGDFGDAMYVIVFGRLRVFDGNHTLNYLEERAVVGEMALLDPAPRSASVAAETDTLLLELTSDMLNLLIAQNTTVAQGIIRVLTRHLRNRVEDLSELRLQLDQQ